MTDLTNDGDNYTGTDGDDIINGLGGDDIIDGGDGDDVISGGSGADMLSGGDGDDTLSGGSGNDTLIGGAGDDTITGGSGIDTVVINANAANGQGSHGGGNLIVSTLDGVDTLSGIDFIQFNNFTVQVVGGNALAHLENDTASIPEVGSSTGQNVLDNDVDIDDSMTVTGIKNYADVAGTIGSSLAGQYGTLTLNADGSYSYVADGSTSGLSDGETVDDTFTYAVTSGGHTSTATLTVAITGTNAEPSLSADHTSATYTDTSGNDTFSTLAGQMSVTDDDTSDTHTFGAAGNGADNSQGGFDESVAGSYGTLYVNSTTGAYEYVVDDAAAEALKTTQHDTFTLTVADNHGGSDTKGLDITINGVNDTPELSADVTAHTYTDTAGDDTFTAVTGQLTGTDRDDDLLTYQVAGGSADNSVPGYDTSVAGSYGTLYLNSASGGYEYVPADGAIEGLKAGATDTFDMTAYDGSATSNTQTLTVTLDGANDTPTITASVPADLTEAGAGEAGTADASATLTLGDRDTGDTANYDTATLTSDGWTDQGGGVWTIDGTYGTATLDTGANTVSYYLNDADTDTDALAQGASATDSFSIPITDGTANNSATVDFNIHGTNDGPVFTVGVQSAQYNDTSGDDSFPDFVSGTVSSSVTANFEDYNDGSVDGQHGWGGSGIPVNPSIDQAVVDNTYGYSEFGTKVFRISDAYTTGSFADWVYSPSLANEAGETSAEGGGMSGGLRQSHFEAQFDFASASTSYQPGASITVAPDRGDGARMSYVRFDDQADGVHVMFDDYETALGDFVETDVATIDRTSVHSIKLTMDLVDGVGNDVVDLYVDGSLVHVGTSWEDYFREQEGNPTRTVDSLLFRSGGWPAPGTAGAGFLFDNITLTSQTGPLTAFDPDTGDAKTFGIQGGLADNSHVGYDTAVAGLYGTLYLNSATGAYEYVPDDAAVEALKTTQHDNFTFTVTDSHGEMDTRGFDVTVNSVNDQPDLAPIAGVTYTDTAADDTVSPATGNLVGSDRDNDTLTYDATGSVADGSLPGYDHRVDGTYGTLYFNATTGAYDYDVGDGALESLKTTAHDVFTFTASDGSLTSTGQTLDITLNGVNDTPDISATSPTATLAEAGGVSNGTAGTADSSVTVSMTDRDAGDTPTFDGTALAGNGWSTSDAGATYTQTGTYGTATLTVATGEVSYHLNDSDGDTEALNDGDEVTDAFTVYGTDGSAGVSTTVTFTIDGSNDAAVVSGALTGNATEAGGVANGTAGSGASGIVTDTDIDNDDNTFQSASGNGDNSYGSYTVDGAGNWTFTVDDSNAAVQALNVGGSLNDTFTILTADGTAQQISVTIHGANDAAIVSGTSSGSVTESGGTPAPGTPTSTGTLTDTDIDNAANTFQVVNSPAASTGGYGTYTVDAAGNWSYTVNNSSNTVQALNDGDTLSDTFTVYTADGTAQVVTITINGANEIINGTPAADALSGTNFGDTITARGSDDVVNGNNGDDVIFGNAGDDILNGGNGNDTMSGGGGNDILAGGSGTDTALYEFVTADGLKVDLSITGQQDTVVGGLDTLTSIENLVGSSHNDTLIGNAGNNKLNGGNGNDVLEGGDGNDTLIGSGGKDTASYAHAGSGVTVNLAVTAAQNTGGAGTDKFHGIENLLGSSHDDTFHGNSSANVLTGGLGADTLTGAKGVDTFVYGAVGDSTSTTYDSITDMNLQGDLIGLWQAVTGVDAKITSGALSTGSFDSDLATAVNAAHLATGHAVGFKASTGSLAGQTFLVIDTNGTAGYQAGQDLVIHLQTGINLNHLDVTDFTVV